MRRPSRQPSLLPITSVSSHEGYSSMAQFQGMDMMTRSGQYQWHEREDGMLVSTSSTQHEGQTATGVRLIDRENRRVQHVVRTLDGRPLHISNDHAREADDGVTIGRTPGDVGQRFDELVETVTEQLSSRSL